MKMVLGIYGAGGFGKEIYDMVSQYERDKWDAFVFVDDVFQGDTLRGERVMPYEAFRRQYGSSQACLAIAQGEPENKRLLYERVKADGYELAVLVHPHAYICPDVVLEEGVVVFVGSTISSTVKMGKCVTALTYTLVGHDSEIGDFCQISPMTVVNGHVRIGEGSFIGCNSSIRDEVTIGKHSVIGMASAVMKDVPDDVIVMGNPARVVQRNTDRRVFQK